jgi:hypothetical protein
MAEPTQIVQVLKQESAGLSGSAADEVEYPSPINPHEDVIEAAGYQLQDSADRDETVKMWRQSGSMVFKDQLNTTPVTLSDLLYSFSGSAANLDFLLDNEPVSSGSTYTNVRTGNKVTQETYRRLDGSKLKTSDYTYSGNFVILEIRKIYAQDGVSVVAQTTQTYTYSGGLVNSISASRDV